MGDADVVRRYQAHDLAVTPVRPDQDNSEPIENLATLSDPVSFA